MKKGFLFVTLIFAGLAAVKSQVAVIPFELEGSSMYVKTKVNTSDSLWFLFDTGGGGILIDSLAAEKAGVSKKGRKLTGAGGVGGYQTATSVQNQRLELAGISLKNVEFTMMNLGAMNTGLKRPVAGIIGYELMEKYITRIDFERRVMLLFDKIGDIDLAGYTKIPFDYYQDQMIPCFPVNITLDNQETFTGKAIFDSGAGLSMLVFAKFRNKYDLGTKLGKTVTSQGRGMNLATTDEQAVLKQVSFNGFSFDNVPANVNVNDTAGKSGEYLGLLGFDIIKHFDVVMDYGHKAIYLKLRDIKAVKPEISALSIGSLLPDVLIGKTVPVANNGLRTADFKDKLLILDLWATNCTSCIEAMPRLDSLRKVFGDAIKILPVTDEPEQAITAFWKKNRNTKKIALATVVEDRQFSAYFPHRTISHEVWVYKGKVIAITGMEQVTAANIQKVLDGQQVNLPLKYDFDPKYDGAKQVLADTATVTVNTSNLTKYATISKYKDEVRFGAIVNEDRGGVVRDKSIRAVRSYFVNQPVYHAYLWALLNARGADQMEVITAIYGGNASFAPNRVVWDVDDKSKYQHAVCFESLYPDTGASDREVYGQMVRDMNDLLGLDVHFERRKVKVLVLTRTAQTDLLKTKNAGVDESYHEVKEGALYSLKDNTLSAFTDEFNQHAGNLYAINDTKYAGKVDIDLNIPSWTDVAAVRKELAKYGLGLKEEVRVVEQLIFTETGGGYKGK